MPGGRDEARARRLERRWLTLGGNRADVPIPITAVTLALVFGTAEQDALYGVLMTPNWGTTFWVTNKSATGCTLHFGTAAPANATCAVVIFREVD